MPTAPQVIHEAPFCDCGKQMHPRFINVTNFGELQRYIFEWFCTNDKEHDRYVSRRWSQRNDD